MKNTAISGQQNLSRVLAFRAMLERHFKSMRLKERGHLSLPHFELFE